MKLAATPAVERGFRIALALKAKNGYVTIKGLMEEFGVSEPTVKRDLLIIESFYPLSRRPMRLDNNGSPTKRIAYFVEQSK